MNRLIGWCIIFLFINISVFGQDQTTTEKDSAIFKLDDTTIDFGTIKKGSDPYRLVKFRNTGNAPLIVNDIKTPCTCTVAYKPEGEILPGDTDVFKIRYDTNKVGVFNETITIHTNGMKKTVKLKIKGKVEG